MSLEDSYINYVRSFLIKAQYPPGVRGKEEVEALLEITDNLLEEVERLRSLDKYAPTPEQLVLPFNFIERKRK
jgi:hypothetical protein